MVIAMRNKLLRRAAVLTAALFSLTCMSVTAYAQSHEPVEETTPPAAEETTAKPFTPDGTGTVVDNATGEDGKEFFTITTADEAVFYLVIDRQRSTENVYFLNAVTVSDLMALAEQDQEPEAPPPVTEPDPEPEPDPAPEPEPQKTGGAGMLLAALAVLALGGGAGWYFKIYRPKQQRAAEPEEDHADYDEPDDYDDAPPWDVDDEDEGGDE